MTRLARFLVLVLFGFVVACGVEAQEPAKEMDRVMADFARLDLFTGTVLVARGGNIVYAKAFGEANKDHRVANILETKFNIGSIGKTFTGVAIMQLVEQGKVELTAPVSSYLEGFPYGDKITIHHLLSHTSGMSNYMAHPEYRARMAGLREIDDWLALVYDQGPAVVGGRRHSNGATQDLVFNAHIFKNFHDFIISLTRRTIS